jgi:hypothetical protein
VMRNELHFCGAVGSAHAEHGNKRRYLCSTGEQFGTKPNTRTD